MSCVAELTVNRRQHAPWEQAALDQLRHGDITAAFATYQAHGRVVLDDDRHALRQPAITDWNTPRTDGVTLMLAGTRVEAHRLNLLARQILADTGELDLERAVMIGGRSYAPGDHVILRRNHRGQHLAEGDRVHGRRRDTRPPHPYRRAHAHVTLTSGEEVVLDHGYLTAGWLDYGYTSTVHTTQGVTCDHVLVVGPAGPYREAVYVAMSRARLSAWIYGTTTEATRHCGTARHRHPAPGERVPDAEHELHRAHPRLRREAAGVVAGCRGGTDQRPRHRGPGRQTARPRAEQARHAERVAEQREGHTNPAEPSRRPRAGSNRSGRTLRWAGGCGLWIETTSATSSHSTTPAGTCDVCS